MNYSNYMNLLNPGIRVRLRNAVERYDHALVPAGCTGVVARNDLNEPTSELFAVKLDQHFPGLDAWDNELIWNLDSIDCNSDDPLVRYEHIARDIFSDIEIIATPEELATQYVKFQGVFCPRCGCPELRASEMRTADLSVWSDVTCKNPDCEETWRECYSLTEIEQSCDECDGIAWPKPDHRKTCSQFKAQVEGVVESFVIPEFENWGPAAEFQQLSRTHRITGITVSGVSAEQRPLSGKTKHRILNGLAKHFGIHVDQILVFPFDAFELHGCRNLNDDCEPDREGKNVEQVEDESEATYFALYGHVPGRGLEWLWDFPTKSEAETGLIALNAMLGYLTREKNQ